MHFIVCKTSASVDCSKLKPSQKYVTQKLKSNSSKNYALFSKQQKFKQAKQCQNSFK